jgi:hypothetical protein
MAALSPAAGASRAPRGPLRLAAVLASALLGLLLLGLAAGADGLSST